MKEVGTNINQWLINTLLLHSSFTDNLGLLNGKMGISIFFYRLARKAGNIICEDYTGQLLDQIFNTPPVELFTSGGI